MMYRSAAISIALVMLVAGCSRDEGAGTAPPPEEALFVYAAGLNEPDLEERLGAFTEATGIKVNVRYGQRQLIDDVIGHAGDPPADVLLTNGVYGAWRAADEGGLRPLTADFAGVLPGKLRDPDGSWVAVGYSRTAIVYDVRAVNAADTASWQSVAEPGFAGRLCLSSSALPGNRTLIAMLIGELGVRPAEILVRQWLANLAEPVYPDQDSLLGAIGTGKCAAGIVTLEDGGELPGGLTGTLRRSAPSTASGDIVAAGVARHAANPEAANRFIAWLVAEPVGGDPAQAAAGDLPAANISIGGWRGGDAIALAERAGYP